MPSVLLDPTLVYSLLIVGLWLSVTAMYIPGTGVAEAAALLTLGAAFVALLFMPTNWISLTLLVGGMGAFVAIPFISPQHTRWTDMALVVQGVGSVFLFRGTIPNLLLIATMLVVAYVYHHYLLLPILKRMRHMPIVGSDIDELMGAEGYVMKGATPPEAGTAQINGEMWTVRSSAALQRGDTVRVIAIHGLELQVDRLKNKHTPDEHYTNGAVLVEKDT